MPPVRKDHLIYNVYDVIDAVQNRNSDFEKDSDTSDEEECGDACELEKENKKPNDRPWDDYVDIMPTKPCHSRTQTMPRDRYLWLKKDFISTNTDFSEAVFGEAKVICSGGDPFDNLLLANQSAIQFGQHRGRTFKWMLDNDLGYSLMVLASHQREHEAGRMDRGVLMFNKVAFLQYACAFPEVAEYIRLRRQREGTLPGCEGDCLVGFGLHKRTTYKELYDTKDKERRSSSIIFTAHTSQLSSTGAECRSKKGISGF
ncbi:uncharacterized protein LOC127450594 isoform X2 [Myxocyprinus asiaticus]|uniref:uncharacterized protein LOC127450594 isoform X2 n=1 Tax=Myxocyprinus asiaticus TaxID=70543 RepID=UPI002222620B|nr:uncharacterized protein LOC127450594 isoform X2 [Myxocyprinus asiaticus]